METNQRNQMLKKLDKAHKSLQRYYRDNSLLVLKTKLKKRWIRIWRALKILPFIPEECSAEMFWGRKFTLPVEAHLTPKLYAHGILTENEYALTRFLVKNLKSQDIFYDIGASFGFYTALAGELVKEVHAFEPSKTSFTYLQKNFESCNSVIINQVAISDQSGTIEFYDNPNEKIFTGATLNSDVCEDSCRNLQSTQVSSKKLDEYVKDQSPPRIIKIDVEGAEDRVLFGGGAVINNYHPNLIMEVWGGDKTHNQSIRALRFLKDSGYKPFRITKKGNQRKLTFKKLFFRIEEKTFWDNYLFRS
ncbi:MAG: FkbM family methyltransferase [Clostridiales bacterium]|nr:FkbM family methyltransferase [Clostridiales bacterium]